MRVGILGHTGFVGKNLQEHLTSEGIDWVGGSRRNSVDAYDKQSILNWMVKEEITHVVHLAAMCGGIGMNQRQPADLWHAATVFGANVLWAANLCRIEKVVMFGTICSYAAETPVPFREDDLMHHGEPEPTNRAYGVAKLSSLYGAQAYEKQWGLRCVNLLPVNMYGPHDHFDLEDSHVIPAIIRKVADAMEAGDDVIHLWGDGTPTREFLYVEDCCRAVVLALRGNASFGFINVGTGRETSISDLAAIIMRHMGFKGDVEWSQDKPNGQMRRMLDIGRARVGLGYEPQVHLGEGLRRTIEWYMKTREQASTPG